MSCFNVVNSLRPGGAYMRHCTGSSLVQEMACWLMTPSHYPNQCWFVVKRNSSILIQENTFKNVVCEKAAILSRPHTLAWRYVGPSGDTTLRQSCYSTLVWRVATDSAPSHYIYQYRLSIWPSVTTYCQIYIQLSFSKYTRKCRLKTVAMPRILNIYTLTHWDRVTHRYVIELSHHWFK